MDTSALEARALLRVNEARRVMGKSPLKRLKRSPYDANEGWKDSPIHRNPVLISMGAMAGETGSSPSLRPYCHKGRVYFWNRELTRQIASAWGTRFNIDPRRHNQPYLVMPVDILAFLVRWQQNQYPELVSYIYRVQSLWMHFRFVGFGIRARQVLDILRGNFSL